MYTNLLYPFWDDSLAALSQGGIFNTMIMIETREESELLFQTGDAAAMLLVTPRTVRNWAKAGMITYFLDGMSKRMLLSLEEINRVRKLRQLPPLSQEQAIDIWKERHKR